MGFFRCCFSCHRSSDEVEHQWDPPQVIDGDAVNSGAVRVFKWAEVEKMTGEFTASAVIGEGGFSTVYVGRLPDSKGEVTVPGAFKVQHSSERLYRAFLQERDVLLRVEHPNVVSLIGYSDDHENGVLIFEYIPNGTLHDKLHPTLKSTPPLSWAHRMSILYQVATAIDYLHDGCELQIVHGDITASNILLDSDLNPKLCDFGSARMGFSAAVVPAPSGYLTGSPGYADPHYLRTGIISKKSDVYSFGVLVYEVVSGLWAVGSDGRFLTARVRGGRVMDYVDPTLGGNFDVGELDIMGDVAGRCVGELGSRPSMGEVVRIMKENVNVCLSRI